MLVPEVAHYCLMLKFSNELVSGLVLFLAHGVQNGCRLRHVFVRMISVVEPLKYCSYRVGSLLTFGWRRKTECLDNFLRCWAHDTK